MTGPQPPAMFDRRRHRRNLDAAAERYSDYRFLKERVSTDVIARLDDVSRTFPCILDLGARDGFLTRSLRGRRGVEQVIAADLSQRQASRIEPPKIVFDEEALPFGEAVFDLVVSTLSLYWVNDLPGALVQLRRALKPDGLFLGALMGAGTLRELRESLLAAETETTGGAAMRLSPLPGLQDMAGLLQRAGFALPVADTDEILVRYDTPFDLLNDLRGMGEGAAFADNTRPGLTRRILQRMSEIYAERFSDPDGRIRASFSIIHVSGWAPSESQPKPLRPGSAKARLAEALGSVEQSAGDKTRR